MHKLVFGCCVRHSIFAAKLEGYIFGCYLVFIDEVSIFLFIQIWLWSLLQNCLRNPLKELLNMAEFEIEDFDVGK